MLQWLLEHGGDVAVRDHDGDTPLHACENPECAALLLEKKADLEATNAEGQTPLAMAIEDERVEMLQWFQEQGIGDGVEALTAQAEEEGRPPFVGHPRPSNLFPFARGEPRERTRARRVVGPEADADGSTESSREGCEGGRWSGRRR